MKDRRRRPDPTGTEDNLDLTMSIRNLSMPIARSNGTGLPGDESLSALLVCRDNASQKWGPRWLRQSGLTPVLITDPDKALSTARSTRPDVIIVEASLQDKSGSRLFQVLQDAADVLAPVIALCANTKEVLAAVGADVFDVVRKPVEWQLTGRRAMRAAKSADRDAQLDQSRESLSKALELAENARQHLRSKESFEPVTGLPNKTKFMDLLRRGMSAADRDSNVLAVFVVGFNRFRLVIEAMGQETANLVLAEVSTVLSEYLHDASSTQINTGGLRTAVAANIDLTRFGLMLTCSQEGDELTALQQKLIDSLSRPVQVSGQTVYLSACVGVALYPQDASEVDSLLQRADNAMRDAQSRGGGYRFYCEETDAAAVRKLKIEHMLHEAFDNGELRLAYQPITTVSDGQIVGAEALLRWQQEDGIEISPAEFVPVAEDAGMMNRIGEFVLEEACRQLKAWQEDGFPSLRMSVNVAKLQLMSGGFVNMVQAVLNQYGLQPADLDLELSERGVLSGDYEVISQLHELKRLGVRLSIDDFGVGDSAISYLKELPVDVMKIDRSYIAGLADGGKDAALTSGMVALGQSLKLTVIAEGVETPEQLSILQDLGCDEYQGFLLSPAIPSEEFTKLIQKTQKK